MGPHSALITHARRLAVSAHAGQKDKIGEDYIHHPASVVQLLHTLPAYLALPESEQATATAAAWLHDAMEDSALTAPDLLREGLSARVVQAVEALTHHSHEPRAAYYERVKRDPLARLVKIADVAHNSSSERLRWLDDATRDRLERKYRIAAAALLASEEEQSWFAAATTGLPVSRSSR